MNKTTDKARESQTFLDQFSPQQRSLVANHFYYAVRGGSATVGDVLAAVARDARERLAAGLHVESQSRLLKLLPSLEARSFAAGVLHRENLPEAEKQKLRAEKSKHFQQEYLKAQKPTVKQLSYLKDLSCAHIPQTRLEAMELIDAARSERGAA